MVSRHGRAGRGRSFHGLARVAVNRRVRQVSQASCPSHGMGLACLTKKEPI
jgi:hypothetical protein